MTTMVTTALPGGHPLPRGQGPTTHPVRRGASSLAVMGSLVLSLAVQLTGVPAAHAGTLVVYDLGVLPGTTFSEASAINSRGYVAGYSGNQAAAWNPDR